MQHIAAIFLTLSLATPTYAVTDQERSVLQRLHSELKILTSIIDEAELAANPRDRQHIEYQQLKNDLNKILQGISDAVTAERREPRSLLPIDGDYH